MVLQVDKVRGEHVQVGGQMMMMMVVVGVGEGARDSLVEHVEGVLSAAVGHCRIGGIAAASIVAAAAADDDYRALWLFLASCLKHWKATSYSFKYVAWGKYIIILLFRVGWIAVGWCQIKLAISLVLPGAGQYKQKSVANWFRQ